MSRESVPVPVTSIQYEFDSDSIQTVQDIPIHWRRSAQEVNAVVSAMEQAAAPVAPVRGRGRARGRRGAGRGKGPGGDEIADGAGADVNRAMVDMPPGTPPPMLCSLVRQATESEPIRFSCRFLT